MLLPLAAPRPVTPVARRRPGDTRLPAAALAAVSAAHARPCRSARRFFGRQEPAEEAVKVDPKSVRIHNDTEMALELLAFPKENAQIGSSESRT